jgi:hypothetical protein
MIEILSVYFIFVLFPAEGTQGAIFGVDVNACLLLWDMKSGTYGAGNLVRDQNDTVRKGCRVSNVYLRFSGSRCEKIRRYFQRNIEVELDVESFGGATSGWI